MTCTGRQRCRFFASSAAPMNTQSSRFLGHRGANKARVGCQTCPALCARTLPHTSSDGDSGQLVSDGDGFRHSRLTAAGRGRYSRKEASRMSNRQHSGCHLPTSRQDGIGRRCTKRPSYSPMRYHTNTR
ncbi:uncharacterized protein ASPGLDRAFT_624911 [Aspergillus glaucus CBS 516.65]|uniref:Uncharacterized protein n=1 Tax=Aspergillus glaucus CBS 516.65 TaxID=1160497 RepID=A0A1L9VCF3_ASPGL|nr:hypothetical protein ASPGLDRAFT_624911 [Aspergillus glaucus CBS 516.65]OJJ81555.1 hypothetical protein ASPGLDRAFT_624911 [Aspergillus glaucus CBS 516.65]